MFINKFNLILSINSKITQLILYVQSVYLKANKFCYQNLSLITESVLTMHMKVTVVHRAYNRERINDA